MRTIVTALLVAAGISLPPVASAQEAITAEPFVADASALCTPPPADPQDRPAAPPAEPGSCGIPAGAPSPVGHDN